MSHERGFRILKCIRMGFRARWAPRPPRTAPRHLQTTICLLICVPSGLICRRLLVHISKKNRNVPAHWCAFGNAFFQQSIGTLEMKQTTGLARGRHSWHGGGVAEGNWIGFQYGSNRANKFKRFLYFLIFQMLLRSFMGFILFRNG